MEIFPLVDREGNVIGEAGRNECHGSPAMLHPVVHCIIRSGDGRWLLQKRSAAKDIQPGKWDTSVGGHVMAGEDILQALAREVLEEVGIDITGMCPEFLHSYVHSNEIESELVYTYTLVCEGDFSPQASEIDELKFWTVEEITAKLDTGIFTPNFVEEFRRVNLRS